MKVILTQKITKLGNIGDTVVVAMGFARNYLLPNGKAMRWSKENMAVFEAQKAELVAKHEGEKTSATANLPKVTAAKLHMIRSAGDTGHLYGSVSSRDIAKLLGELTGIAVLSEQVRLGGPIKEIGAWDVKIALHPDVIADVKVFVAQTQDEIDALVAGKSIKKNEKKLGTEPTAEEAAPPESKSDLSPEALAKGEKIEAAAEASAETEEAAAESEE